MLITNSSLKTISLAVLLGCLLNSATTQAAEELLLKKSLDLSVNIDTGSTVVVNLYPTQEAGLPLASQAFFPGEWQLARQRDRQTLTLSFTELDREENHRSLWMEMQSDGLRLGRRVLVQAATAPGVTFASGNPLNMDGNAITNLAAPNANQDAATKAYVDSKVGAIPVGDITAVTAGAGLAGGGTTGEVALEVTVPLSLTGSEEKDGIIKATNTAKNGYGVKGVGTEAGGYFKNSNDRSYTYVGNGEESILTHGPFTGITALSERTAGYFFNPSKHTSALVAGDYGIEASSVSSAGGYFYQSGSSTDNYAKVGGFEYGIEAYGDRMGGYFKDSNGSGYAQVGYGDFGIKAYGNFMGGYFEQMNNHSFAEVASNDYGIWAFGNTTGGHFGDNNGSGYANVGIGDTGIESFGNTMGGHFKDLNNSGYADAGIGDTGIEAYGNTSGGYFEEPVSGNSAIVANKDYGIVAYGNFAGGYFEDRDSGNFADVGYSTYKIWGTGTVNFVQNHPQNTDAVIVYTAPEGDEVATYTRGSARLINGEAHIPLGKTFQWVTNPDIGLTAHLTPRGNWAALYVVSLTTSELVVKAAPDSSTDTAFDYLVYGLRIGFEDNLVVQKKNREARIPSMADHRRQFDEHPEMHQYTALSRFARMQGKDRETVRQNMRAATALLQAVEEFDPRIHKIPFPDHSKKQISNDHKKP